MLETNSKCFGYYTSQITHICGPDAALECPLADADAGGKPSCPRGGQWLSRRRWSTAALGLDTLAAGLLQSPPTVLRKESPRA